MTYPLIYYYMNTKSKITVSIAIICYNQIEFIAEAIEGALNQEYDNLQIVVSDDGSTDGTDKIVSEYANKFPAKIVSLTGGPNLGITGNCNRALQACSGKYVAFQGGDDVLLPGKILKQIAWFEEDDSRVLCGHQVEVIYESGDKSHNYHRNMFLLGGRGASNVIRFGVPYCACAIMVKASAMPDHGFATEMPTCSDHMLWAEVLAGGGRYGHISGTYAQYRRHSGNITKHAEKYISELETMLYIFPIRYPAYASICTSAKGSLIYYGYGVFSFNNKEYSKALIHFIQALKICPTHYKIWVRLVQLTYNMALLKLGSR